MDFHEIINQVLKKKQTDSHYHHHTWENERITTLHTGIWFSSRKFWLQFLFFPSVNVSALSWDKPTVHSLRSLSGLAQGSSERILSWNIPPLMWVKHSGIEKSLCGIMGNETWDAFSMSSSDWSGWKQWLVSTYARHAEQTQREPEGQAERSFCHPGLAAIQWILVRDTERSDYHDLSINLPRCQK